MLSWRGWYSDAWRRSAGSSMDCHYLINIAEIETTVRRACALLSNVRECAPFAPISRHHPHIGYSSGSTFISLAVRVLTIHSVTPVTS